MSSLCKNVLSLLLKYVFWSSLCSMYKFRDTHAKKTKQTYFWNLKSHPHSLRKEKISPTSQNKDSWNVIANFIVNMIPCSMAKLRPDFYKPLSYLKKDVSQHGTILKKELLATLFRRATSATWIHAGPGIIVMLSMDHCCLRAQILRSIPIDSLL